MSRRETTGSRITQGEAGAVSSVAEAYSVLVCYVCTSRCALCAL